MSGLHQIVGLVKNTKYVDLRDDYEPIAYYPALQEAGNMSRTNIASRSNSIDTVLPSIGKAIAEMNPAISVELRDGPASEGELSRERLLAPLSTFFGGLAALLATIGLYGLITYMVAQRTSKIGIRMALGATPGQMVTMVLGEQESWW